MMTDSHTDYQICVFGVPGATKRVDLWSFEIFANTKKKLTECDENP